MSFVVTKELEKVEKVLLALDPSQLSDFIEYTLQRYKQERQISNKTDLNYFSSKTREKIRQALKEHAIGKGTILSSAKEIDAHFDKFKINENKDEEKELLEITADNFLNDPEADDYDYSKIPTKKLNLNDFSIK